MAAICIVINALAVLSTVKLNDQAFLEAHKIDDVGAQRLRSTKFIAVKLAQPKVSP